MNARVRSSYRVSRFVPAGNCRIFTRNMGNTFGQLFRITTWGESHGGGVGVVVDGCPPRIPLTEADLQPDLDRRRPGQSRITTPRKESDTIQILSGTFEGQTLGTPLGKRDQRGFHKASLLTSYRKATTY